MKGILGEVDGLIYLFPYRLFSSRQWLQGSIPLWNPYSLCGYPLLAALQPSVLYPLSFIFFLLFAPVTAFNVSVLLHFSLAGFFTYLYMRTLKASTVSSLFAGVAFMFCGFLSQWANNTVVQNSSAWLPLILFFMERSAVSRKFVYVFCAACCFAMIIFAGYPQVFLCTALVVFFYTVYLAVCAEKNRARFFLNGFLIAALGCLLGAIQLLPTKELVELSIRTIYSIDHEMIGLTSFQWKYAFLFLFPYYYGSLNPGGFYPHYYGTTSPFPYLFEGVCYMGILPMLLAGTAMLKRHKGDRIVLFWSGMVVVTFIILQGKNNPLFPFIFKTIFLSRFYNISIHMYVLNFAVAILGGFGLEYLMRNRTTHSEKKLHYFLLAGVVAIIVIGLLVCKLPPGGNMAECLGKLAAIAPLITNRAVYIPIISITASVLIYCLLLFRPAHKAVQALLMLILFLDLFFFGHFLHQHSVNVDALLYKDSYPPVINYLTQAETDLNGYRVLPLVSVLSEIQSYDFIVHNTNILYPISSITGYDPLYFQKHFELFNPGDRNGTFKDPSALPANNRIISLLNVKYLVALPLYKPLIESLRATAVAGSQGLLPVSAAGSGPQPPTGETVPLYPRVFTSPGGVSIYRNPNALPRAYLVEKVRSVKGFDEARRILTDPDVPFDQSREALVELPAPGAPAALTSGTATVTSYKAQEVVIKTQSAGRSFLVLSDTWYPGWKAFIDGKETAIYPTNGIVRGLFVDAGSHEVSFVYSPASFKTGAAISLTTLFACLLACMAGRSKKKAPHESQSICRQAPRF
jgi:hypothetical protein